MSTILKPTMNYCLGRQWVTYSSRKAFKSSQNFQGKRTKWLKNSNVNTKNTKTPATGTSEQSATDWIGPPDPDSNLRPIKFHIPQDETPLEREYRTRRELVMRWNQEYWAKHNRKFTKEKQEFVINKLREVGDRNPDGSKRQLTAEELSEFYKLFLNENYKAHRNYNSEWYKKNISLLWPALKLVFVRTVQRRSREL